MSPEERRSWREERMDANRKCPHTITEESVEDGEVIRSEGFCPTCRVPLALHTSDTPPLDREGKPLTTTWCPCCGWLWATHTAERLREIYASMRPPMPKVRPVVTILGQGTQRPTEVTNHVHLSLALEQ